MLGLVFDCVLGSTCIALFAFGARQEGESPYLWGGLSLGIWILTLWLFGGGILHTLLGQGPLYAAMYVRLGRKGRGTPPRRPSRE